MNKKDLPILIFLILLIPAWMIIDRTIVSKKFPASQPAPIEQSAETSTGTAAAIASTEGPAAAISTDVEIPAEERLETLENGKLKLQLTSIGGGVKTATFITERSDGSYAFPKLNEANSAPVALDFSNSTALAYDGLEGLGARDGFGIEKAVDGRSVTFTKALPNGLTFQRVLTLGDEYTLNISDRFANPGDAALNLPPLRLLTGYMRNPADLQVMKGISILGVDSHTPDGGVNYWGKKLNKLYKRANKAPSIDSIPEDMHGVQVDWVAAKNKFFTQIINPQAGTPTMALLSSRDMNEKGIVPTEVAAALSYPPITVNAGATFQLNHDIYVGPKQYSILKTAGNHMEKVMEFETIGFFSFMNWLMEPARIALLWLLNTFHNLIPNYGIAIILLTIFMRGAFWPLTHKSTHKMRENSEKMQVIQPKLKAIQEKYKGDPRRIQHEQAKLYKEENFNPMAMMGGCLPLLLQMPIFFALFTVLRNAIELRYSDFLWISDLSQPEDLLAGKLPLISALKILPLVFTLTMFLQQKVSMANSVAATPEQQQQQKMMLYMMPLMMLFVSVNMPSGLVLYWSTSNILMILQTAFYNFRKKRKAATS